MKRAAVAVALALWAALTWRGIRDMGCWPEEPEPLVCSDCGDDLAVEDFENCPDCLELAFPS